MAALEQKRLLEACRALGEAVGGQPILPPLIREAGEGEGSGGTIHFSPAGDDCIRLETRFDKDYVNRHEFPLRRLPLVIDCALCDSERRPQEKALEEHGEVRAALRLFPRGADPDRRGAHRGYGRIQAQPAAFPDFCRRVARGFRHRRAGILRNALPARGLEPLGQVARILRQRADRRRRLEPARGGGAFGRSAPVSQSRRGVHRRLARREAQRARGGGGCAAGPAKSERGAGDDALAACGAFCSGRAFHRPRAHDAREGEAAAPSAPGAGRGSPSEERPGGASWPGWSPPSFRSRSWPASGLFSACPAGETLRRSLASRRRPRKPPRLRSWRRPRPSRP